MFQSILTTVASKQLKTLEEVNVAGQQVSVLYRHRLHMLIHCIKFCQLQYNLPEALMKQSVTLSAGLLTLNGSTYELFYYYLFF